MGERVSKAKYHAIRNALGYTEKEIISFYEVEWFLRHRVPTVDEVVKYINNKYEKEGKHHRTTHTSVNYYLGRRKMQKALDDRGINWRQHSQVELTQAQVAAAVTVMNFADTRSIPEKLDQLGVNPSQYYAWQNDPTFKNLLDQLSEQNLQNIKPTAIAEFTKKVNKGDWNAIKYYLDATGVVKSNDAPQSETLVMMLIEIIQKHVKDSDTMIAIANDIQAVMQARTLEIRDPRKELTGEVINSEEVIQAEKMLGFG